jgi:hypothetical protein
MKYIIHHDFTLISLIRIVVYSKHYKSLIQYILEEQLINTMD